MAYVDSEARQDLLDSVAEAIGEIAAVLATLGEVYEQLDERSADVLEEQLFRPAQVAYGRAKRTYADFAARSAMRGRTFLPGASRAPASAGARILLDAGGRRRPLGRRVDRVPAGLLLPVEVGDAELRAGLAEVRRLLADLPTAPARSSACSAASRPAARRRRVAEPARRHSGGA
jgi:hypothetical protein